MKSKHTTFMTFFGYGLYAVGVLFASSSVQDAFATDPHEISINATTDGIAMNFSAHSNRDVLTFNVRIVGADRLVFDRRTLDTHLQWIPLDDLKDGWYNWEAWVVTVESKGLMLDLTPTQRRRSPEHWFERELLQTHLASGHFHVQNGVLVQEPQDNAENLSLIKRVASAIVDFLIPSAHAQSLVADNEVLINRDTFGPRVSLFDPDLNTVLPLWRMQMTPNPGNHLEFRYCNFALFGCAVGTEFVAMTLRRDTGRIGIGATAPNSRLHLNTGTNEDALRVQVNNDTSFFVSRNRGVTIGDFATPPPRGLYIPVSGAVGLGTTTPTAALHLRRFNNTATMRIEETGSSPQQELLRLKHNGAPLFVLEDSMQSTSWTFRTGGTVGTVSEGFIISKIGTGVPELLVRANGDLQINGTLIELSSRERKTNIEIPSYDQVLAKLAQMDVPHWSYDNSPGIQHIGPMAEDFFSLFGYGQNDRTISPRDIAGVALAAAKALMQRVDDLETENISLRREVSQFTKLQDRIAALEAQVENKMILQAAY